MSQQVVRSIDIANLLGFSKPSVSVAMKHLREEGMITVDDNGYIALTEAGMAAAKATYEKHVVLTNMLVRLGVSAYTAGQDACRIEHVLSPETFEKIKEQGVKGITNITIDDANENITVETLYGEKTLAYKDCMLERCHVCKGKEHQIFDETIGESRDTKDADRFAEVEKIEAMSPEEKFAFFQNELRRCIRCNACRNVCPACSCRKCVFDSTKFDSAQKANVDSFEEKMFHIIRAFHVAGRCTDCGECSRVCPQGIPLHLFNRKFIKDIDEFYGEFQAGADPEAKSPLTSFTFNDVEPGVTGGRR